MSGPTPVNFYSSSLPGHTHHQREHRQPYPVEERPPEPAQRLHRKFLFQAGDRHKSDSFVGHGPSPFQPVPHAVADAALNHGLGGCQPGSEGLPSQVLKTETLPDSREKELNRLCIPFRPYSGLYYTLLVSYICICPTMPFFVLHHHIVPCDSSAFMNFNSIIIPHFLRRRNENSARNIPGPVHLSHKGTGMFRKVANPFINRSSL
jgi:hypothetical protein